MEGLLIGSIATEIQRDREREAEAARSRRLARKTRPRTPQASWLMSGSLTYWHPRGG